jgi:hypothetical protein
MNEFECLVPILSVKLRRLHGLLRPQARLHQEMGLGAAYTGCGKTHDSYQVMPSGIT